MHKWTPTDAIACLVIVGAFALMFTSRDGVVAASLAMIVGYYFGKKASSLPHQ